MVLRKFPIRFLLLTVSAILTGLCFAWYKAGFIVLFSLVPMFLVLLAEADGQSRNPLRFYGHGYYWGAVMFATVFQWFRYQYPLEYLGFNRLEAVGYVALSWFGSGLILSVLLALFHFFTGLFLRTSLCRGRRYLLIPFSAACYVLIEFLFTLGSLATPWARLAVTMQSNIFFIQTASVFGSYFISSLIVAVNASLALAVYSLVTRKDRRLRIACFSVAVGIFLTNTACGALLYAADKKAESGERVTAAALQGNIISGRTRIGVQETIDLFLERSADEVRENGASLIVMPEGCFNIDLKNSPLTEERLRDFSRENDVVIIIGAYEYGDDELYNVTWCISPDGTVSGPYRKQHPVPFGEFTPARKMILTLFPFLEDVTSLGDDLSAGGESVVFDSTLGRLGAFICFDSAFENIGFEETAKGAVLLTESTNDSWWMDSAQLYEHNGHAVLRAIEARRYYVRSSAAGYSTVIDARGVILDDVPALTAGFASADAVLRDDVSFYHKTPYLFPSVCAMTVVSLFAAALIYKKHGKKAQF